MADNDRKNIAYLTDIEGMAIAASGVTSGNIAQFGTESDGRRALVDSTKKVSDFYTKGEVDTKVSSATSGFWDALCGEYSIAAYLSDPWDTGQVYDVGAYCLHGGAGYRCITAHDSQTPFDPEKWELVLTAEGKSILDDLMSRHSGSGSVSPLDIASAFSSAKTYKVNDLVVQGGLLKICTTAGYGALAEFSSGAVVEKALTAIIGALSGKQDEIADLDDIRAGAAMGADAHDRDRVVVDLSPGEPGDPPTVTAYSHNDTDGEHPVPLAIKADTSALESSLGLKANRLELAEAFSTSETYALGRLVVYNNELYRCVVVHTAGAWNAAHFAKSTVDAAIALRGTGSAEWPIADIEPIAGVANLLDRTVNKVSVQQAAGWSWTASDSNYDHIAEGLNGNDVTPVDADGSWYIGEYIDGRLPAEYGGYQYFMGEGDGSSVDYWVIVDDSAEDMQQWVGITLTATRVGVSSIDFPPAISGVSREFILKLSLGQNVTAPLLPTSVTYEPSAPSLYNGAAIHFTEISAGVFQIEDMWGSYIIDSDTGQKIHADLDITCPWTGSGEFELSVTPPGAIRIVWYGADNPFALEGPGWYSETPCGPGVFVSADPNAERLEFTSGTVSDWDIGVPCSSDNAYDVQVIATRKIPGKEYSVGTLAMKSDVTSIMAQHQANWDESDSTAPEFIKNRPYHLPSPIVTPSVSSGSALLENGSVNAVSVSKPWIWSPYDATSDYEKSLAGQLNARGATPFYDESRNEWKLRAANGDILSLTPAGDDLEAAYAAGQMTYMGSSGQVIGTKTQNVTALSFPAAISGKSRDFVVKMSVTEDAVSPGLPSGMTFLPEPPALTDGAVIRFSEISSGVFLAEEPLKVNTLQSDWAQSNPSAPDYIKNKPRLPEYSVNLDGVVSSEWTFSSDSTGQAALDGASPSLTFHDAVAPDSPYWSLTGLAEGWTAGDCNGGADATSLTFSVPGPDLALAQVDATRSASWLQKKLTFDDSPTPDSDHPVKSGGIQTALDGKLDSSAVYPEFDVGGTEYSTGDIVSFNGRLYRSRQDGNVHHEPSASSEYWESIILRDVNPSCIEDAAGNRINADRSVYHEISEHWEFSWNPSKPANVDLGVPWFSFDQTWQADLLVDGHVVADFTFLAADNQGASSSSLAGTYTEVSSQVSYNVTATKVAGTEGLAGTLALEQGTKVEIGAGADAGTAVGASTGVVQSVAIGYNAMATGNTSTAVGKMADASSAQAIAVGQEAKGPQTGVAIGLRANATAQDTEIVTPTGTGLLDSWDGSGDNGVAIGSDTAVNADSVAVGKKAQARGGTSVSIGSDAEAGFAAPSAGVAASNGSIAIGAAAKAKHTGAISIGSKSSTTGNDGIAIGSLSSAINGTIAIGKGTAVRGSAGVAIGGGSSVEDRGSIAIGGFNSDGKKAIASGQRCVQIGKGTNNTPDSLQFHSANLFEAKTADGSQTHTDTVATLGAGFPSASTEVRGAVKLSNGVLDNSGIARGVGDRAVYAKADGWELVEGQDVTVRVTPRWFATEQEFLQDAYLDAQQENWSGAGWYARLQVSDSLVIAWLGDDPDVYELTDTSETIRFRREILWGASGYVLRASDDLVGQTFDFSSMAGVYGALKALVELFGGTVTNYPQQGGS